MAAWLPIVTAAVVPVALRVIDVAGAIWKERVRAVSRAAQMKAAATLGVVVCERDGDGTFLHIVPEKASQEHESTADTISCQCREMSSL